MIKSILESITGRAVYRIKNNELIEVTSDSVDIESFEISYI